MSLCFQLTLFKKVNGYSNEYWGWGFEDDDLLMRLTEQTCIHRLRNTMMFQKNQHLALYLHGDESYVECHNTIDIT